jgi:hypothetical protein
MAEPDKISVHSSDKVEGEKSEPITPDQSSEKKVAPVKKEGRFDKTFEVGARRVCYSRSANMLFTDTDFFLLPVFHLLLSNRRRRRSNMPLLT